MQEVKKIVIIGPESTGKSTLCKQLAEYYNTLWCPEYAREYLIDNGTDYTYDDLLEIAKGQLAKEEEYLKKVEDARFKVEGEATANQSGNKKPETGYQLLFIDTDMYVMKVWCEFVFGKCHQFILDKIAENTADLYLLCDIDLPWVKDELREYPDLETREKLYNIYKELLSNQSIPWADIHGNYNERTDLAIKTVDNYFFRATGL